MCPSPAQTFWNYIFSSHPHQLPKTAQKTPYIYTYTYTIYCESVVASPYTLRVPSGYLLIAPLAQGGQEEWAVVGIRCLAIVVCRGRHVGCLRTGFPFASA